MTQRQSPTSLIACAVLAASCACMTSALAAPILFTDAGANAAAIQDAVDRAALGNPNNGNAPGPLPGGRREINWDGGGVEVVAMDDFVYAEPQAISEPTILSLIGLALIGLGMLRRRRR